MIKPAAKYTVSQIRDFVGEQGGKIFGRKDELVKVAKLNQFMEKEIPRTYVNRQPNPSGSVYWKINTSCTRSLAQILSELMGNANRFNDTPAIKSLIQDTHRLYQAGEFEDQYNNIARVAPELKEGLIYREFGHIGASKEEKNSVTR